VSVLMDQFFTFTTFLILVMMITMILSAVFLIVLFPDLMAYLVRYRRMQT